MSANQIVRLAAEAGRIILENGGEIYRVEETVNRVCVSYGVRGSQTYATPTVLIVSVADADGQTHSTVERIDSRGINLDKVDAVNQLSREIETRRPGLEEAGRMLQEVRQRPVRRNWIIILFSGLACAAFALLFQGAPADLLPAFCTGAAIRAAALRLTRLRLNDFFINITGGAIASLGGWAWVGMGIGRNGDVIVISALMLLVPGLMLTNAVRDIAAGDLISGISRIMEAFFVAIAIACGTALVYALVPFVGGASL